MRKLLTSLGVAGLMFVAVPALAHPPAERLNAQSERNCERNNGAFIDLGGLAFVCLLPTGANEREIRQAERLCQRSGGALFVAVGNVAFACVLPGGAGLLNDFIDGGGSGGGLLTGPDGLRLFPVIIS
ncbi:MAG: hypothetical protein H0V33_13220 [Acidimicrobiia bacterium]|jgi:hypothetical protein|nr:hypothetical protein [Acidimicrobiia bacterium]